MTFLYLSDPHTQPAGKMEDKYWEYWIKTVVDDLSQNHFLSSIRCSLGGDIRRLR